MYGMLIWSEEGKGLRLESREILGLRFLCAEVRRTERTPESLVRRRVGAAGRRLAKEGVGRVITPERFAYHETLKKYGLSPVSTLYLRRELAAEWVDAELLARGIRPAGVKVGVFSNQITGELVRTVTELSLRHRYVAVWVPRGGEELSRRLRREYGVSLELARSEEALEEAAAIAAFSPLEGIRHPLVLRIYDENQPLPELSLSGEIAARIPPGVCRAQFLAVLRETGKLRKGELSLSEIPSGPPPFGANRALTFPEGTSIILDCQNRETMGKSKDFPLKRYVKGLPTWKKNTE